MFPKFSRSFVFIEIQEGELKSQMPESRAFLGENFMVKDTFVKGSKLLSTWLRIRWLSRAMLPKLKQRQWALEVKFPCYTSSTILTFFQCFRVTSFPSGCPILSCPWCRRACPAICGATVLWILMANGPFGNNWWMSSRIFTVDRWFMEI